MVDEKILIIKHGSFGDIILADGAIRDIRGHHSGAEITVLTTPPYAALLGRCPHIDRVMVDERSPFWRFGKALRLRGALRDASFDKVYDLQNSDRTDLYRRFIFGVNMPWCGRRPRAVPLIGQRAPRYPVLELFARLLRAEGVRVEHTPLPDVLWMKDEVSDLLHQAGVHEPYIVLIAGSSLSHPEKRWPYFGELASMLLARRYQVITVPGPEEIELSRKTPGITLMKNGVEVLNWFELAGVLHGAEFVVGNDTGPSHVASALNLPGLALFGPHVSAAQTGIRRGRFDVIEVEDLRSLPPERVFREVMHRLGELG